MVELLESRRVLAFVVNSTADPGDGIANAAETTLREAIEAANRTANSNGPDTIEFSIPPSDRGHVYYQDDEVAGQVSPSKIAGTSAEDDSLLLKPDPDWPHSWFTIQVASGKPLPWITEALAIDGYTQVGARHNSNSVESNLGLNTVLKIELDGSLGGAGAGLLTDATTPGSMVRGLVIGKFAPGIRLQRGDNSTIEGNFIGTDVSGTIARGNAGGIDAGSTFEGARSHRIGGPTPAARNLISGNNDDGMRIVTTGNRVEGNLIGTDRTGTRALMNHGDAVELAGNNNTVGGIGAGMRNILSGNGFTGAFITGNNNLVQGNFIGTDVTGTQVLGNLTHGVRVVSTGNVIGGNDADDGALDGLVAARNVIAANLQGGISIESASGTRVQGNLIGTDRTGTVNFANGFSPGGSRYGGIIVYLSSNSLIGGVEAGAGNLIAHSAGDGVLIRSATGHAILGNSIHSNGGLGIDLGVGDDGVTPNDATDTDTGANDLQNFPVLTSLRSTPTGTTIEGTLRSTPSTTFRIEFFANAAADPTGFGEGQTFLGAIDVSTNTSGDAAFAVSLPAAVPAGQFITATATVRLNTGNLPFGDSSEFGPAVEAPVAIEPMDYGDAPVSYATLRADDGARHTISTTIRLGSRIDAEDDGQPGPAADRDDLATEDDEDGVVLPPLLLISQLAFVEVTASAPGLLNAWIDWNHDGDWADVGEQAYADRPLVPGLNMLPLQVAPNATSGDTIARFRYSTQAGLSFNGPAADGEVEDYRVWIAQSEVFSRATKELGLLYPNGSRETLLLEGTETIGAMIGPSGESSDTNGNGLDDVPTELLRMDVSGSGSFGTVRLLLDSTQRSLGNMEETANTQAGRLDVPPFSFAGLAFDRFEAYTTLEIGGNVYRPATPLQLGGLVSDALAGTGDSFTLVNGPIDLLDENGIPTGFRLTSLINTPEPWRLTEEYSRATKELGLLYPDGSRETLVLEGKESIEVLVGAAGLASDSDGDGRDQAWTELVALEMSGSSSIGPVRLLLDTTQRSRGEMEERANVTAGLLDVAPFTPGGLADSSVEAHLMLELAGQLYRVGTSVRLDGTVTDTPAGAGDSFTLANGPIDLLDEHGIPTGFRLTSLTNTPELLISPDTGEIRGNVWHDIDTDGQRDSDEPGLTGWIVYADLDDDGVHDGREPSATTSGGGLYTIEGIPPGTFKVREELQPAWKQTVPAIGYHVVSLLPGSSVTDLDFGNQACPADWLVRDGDTLRILGDMHDNPVLVLADRTALLTVTGPSECFYEFTGIRRVEATMDSGHDQVSFVGPATGMLSPIEVDFDAGLGNDRVVFENWRGDLMVDLGPGDDQADLRSGGGTPDPSNREQLRIVAGQGNDIVEVQSDRFFDIFVDLEAGDDRSAIRFAGGGGSPDPPARHLQVNAGLGDDLVQILIGLLPSAASVNLNIDLGAGDDVAMIEWPADPPGLPTDISDTRSLRLQLAAGQGDDLVNVRGPSAFDVVLDLNMGAGDDTARLQLPADNGPGPEALQLEFAGDTGDDVLDVNAITETIVLGDIDLGAGDDTARFDVTAGAGPSRLDLHLAAGVGDDAAELKASSFFDVFFDISLGDGDDTANVRFADGGGSPDPAGKVRELVLDLHGGAGNDTVEIQAERCSDLVINLDLGSGNDAVGVVTKASPTPIVNQSGPPDTSVKIAAGTGNDKVNLQVDAFFDVFVDLDLGQGQDMANLRYAAGDGGSTGPSLLPRELRVKVLGGNGNDILRAAIDAREADQVFLDFDGGTGNDVMRVAYRESRSPGLPARRLHIHLLGGEGNDDLALSVTTHRRRALVDLVIDGGNGRDTYWSTPNVQVRRSEIRRRSPPWDL